MPDGNEHKKGSKWPIDLRIWMKAKFACDILHGTMELNIWTMKNNNKKNH